ncbi:thiamine phosphate synthase [Pararcticibacter amylolyticus]|uniref:Thiamine-phosphate synthase n=1 Tax=Pararcticibacter amylolyticus TaxID=2173175 RepID=A0A2U2PMU5_9SPHI|nr:thiamine phosphate synthase [Pararcticibacter amylolyticus]PWG82711.1 thiamine phosphate synthase [Pararcticibacter amylolyticus]
MKKYISNFHYLTQDLPGRTHVQQALLACEAGANWIQYRCLSKDDHELLDEVNEIAAICDDWGTTLIITDHYHLLDKADIQGVHIEDMQADFRAIRTAIGEDKTLGASANTIADIRRIAESGAVDYIGCGPFTVTYTKPNDYPLLGVEGYKAITEVMQKEGIPIPLLAVGGITIGDTEALLGTGIYGIAVSAAINHADDPTKALREMYRKTIKR